MKTNKMNQFLRILLLLFHLSLRVIIMNQMWRMMIMRKIMTIIMIMIAKKRNHPQHYPTKPSSSNQSSSHKVAAPQHWENYIQPGKLMCMYCKKTPHDIFNCLEIEEADLKILLSNNPRPLSGLFDGQTTGANN